MATKVHVGHVIMIQSAFWIEASQSTSYYSGEKTVDRVTTVQDRYLMRRLAYVGPSA